MTIIDPESGASSPHDEDIGREERMSISRAAAAAVDVPPPPAVPAEPIESEGPSDQRVDDVDFDCGGGNDDDGMSSSKSSTSSSSSSSRRSSPSPRRRRLSPTAADADDEAAAEDDDPDHRTDANAAEAGGGEGGDGGHEDENDEYDASNVMEEYYSALARALAIPPRSSMTSNTNAMYNIIDLLLEGARHILSTTRDGIDTNYNGTTFHRSDATMDDEHNRSTTSTLTPRPEHAELFLRAVSIYVDSLCDALALHVPQTAAFGGSRGDEVDLDGGGGGGGGGGGAAKHVVMIVAVSVIYRYVIFSCKGVGWVGGGGEGVCFFYTQISICTSF
jgi:hypothetical protein